MKICLHLAWKKSGNKDSIYITKILKWITGNEKQQQQNKKKSKEKIKVELLSRAFYRINLYKRYRK